MESSEDDAGAATNASRRASAREKDVAGSEGCSTDGDVLQKPEEAGREGESASLSEEAFDGDSVPSPSATDVNTSTEAILDMIDEIVEGPDAPKRRPRASGDAEVDEASSPSADDSAVDQRPQSVPDPQTTNQPTVEPAPSAKSEILSQESVNLLQESVSDLKTEQEINIVVQESVSLGTGSNEDAIEPCSSETSISGTSGHVSQHESTSNLQPDAPLDSSELVAVIVPENATAGCPSPQTVLSESESTSNVSSKDQQVDITSQSEFVTDNSNSVSIPPNNESEVLPETVPELSRHSDLPEASSSIVSNEIVEPSSGESLSRVEPEPTNNFPSNIPSSSVSESVDNVSNSSESRISERTIKCVTSSDSRDNVTVESAESTSSDSVYENRSSSSSSSGVSTRSPLRRRLVRPAPSDRRPDSTVSSTVDSQTVNVCTTEQSTSDSVAKDVSSSSDAVSSVYDNVKPEEIRNVSEISVCKAETSVSPPKKIKLNRQRVTPMTTQSDVASEAVVNPESDQCQSTSECTPSTLPGPSSSENLPISSEDVRQELSRPNTSSDPVPVETVSESPGSAVQDNEAVTDQSHCLLQSPTIPEDPTPEDNSHKKVPPIKLNLSGSSDSAGTKSEKQQEATGSSSSEVQDDSFKQVPKLTIKLGNKQSEEMKSPIPKLTIKPIRPPSQNEDVKRNSSEQVVPVTKLNIKPIPKPAEKINDIHRKSSSSEISESESSENDESNSTSDQASNSDQGSSDVVPKVTIMVGKPGTESEGKFYTQQNVPKLLIKGINPNENEEQESGSKLKLVVSEADEKPAEKIPKLTIKTVTKSEGQPLSPKLTIKPIKPPENIKSSEAEGPPIPKMKISTDSYSSNVEIKENAHVPKITIKPVVKTDPETPSRTSKKSTACEGTENIPVVTKLNIKPVIKPVDIESTNSEDERVPVISKLNIKPIIKPTDSGNTSEEFDSQVPVVSKLNIKPIVKPVETGESSETNTDNVPVVSKLNIKPIVKPTQNLETSECVEDKVPVVSRLNIKPVIKPKDNEIESSVDEIPKVTKLNIKPLRSPSEEKDCDEVNADTEKTIPVVTKLNIKPIVKPVDEDTSKDSENQSSETGNSSDDNTDIPVVTKINIKPIVKPNDCEESLKPYRSNEDNVPVVTKLNIKPIVKPDECKSPASPKKDSLKITKLNIKPVLKPEEIDHQQGKNDLGDSSPKNPPLLMKINIKSMTETESSTEVKKVNNVDDKSGPVLNHLEENIPKVSKLNIKSIIKPPDADLMEGTPTQIVYNCKASSSHPEAPKQNCVSGVHDKNSSDKLEAHCNAKIVKNEDPIDCRTETKIQQVSSKPNASLQNCTLLKKLLETKKDGLDKRLEDSNINSNHSLPPRPDLRKVVPSLEIEKVNSKTHETEFSIDISEDKVNDIDSTAVSKPVPTENINKDINESITTPLEISISDKITSQSSGQDSPRIILKINKTDHGPSAKIITEESKTPMTPQQNDLSENTQEIGNDNKQTQKRVVNSRKKHVDTPMPMLGKRLRSSRIVDTPDKTPVVKKYVAKRPQATETSPPNKEPELSILESKRLKLGQLLSNKSLTITAVPAKSTPSQVSPTKLNTEIRPPAKTVNHSLLNNENCSKNGNSKLHNILSNLQAKQAQALALNDIKCAEKISITPELESNASTGSSDVVEIVPNSLPEVQEMIINENSESHDFGAGSDELSQDPLEVESSKASQAESPSVPQAVEAPQVVNLSPTPLEMTPQPKKRGRPRKLPVSEGAKPVALPVPALEERPQRSLRLYRDRPAILAKPRGRGRGRGAKRAESESPREETPVVAASRFFDEKPAEEEDPTSSRIKLPRMTEALDKLPGGSTPLSVRRRSSILSEGEPKVVLNLLPKLEEALKSPELPLRGKGSRGGRGGRGRGGTPGRGARGRGRGRGGGRGAQYMKETMGIYGRVCGPATTTVQLFEEETCMMDDNATPAKPSHLLDEDSQSSVKSSTNDSCKKSKFAELFDSNKVWTAADVKEYTWPPPDTPDVEHQIMMIQEQVSMFLGVKSFKRRYPELARRAVCGPEREYLLNNNLVSQPLADLGITAVEASEVLDIMLSDYPHKYEEYRAHQRQRQRELAEAAAAPPPATLTQASNDSKLERIEVKIEAKPEPPKVDLEKTRQEAMAAAIASASEFNTRLNLTRRAACVDMQTLQIHTRRVTQPTVRAHMEPPAGFYPHALLPGQYQHHYRVYPPEELRYFPLNTVLAAPPPPPPSCSESDDDSSDSSTQDEDDRPKAKRKKLPPTKRGSTAEIKEEIKEEVETCRTCGLRLEANRKHTHERFLVCATCNAKLHPGCVDLSADTIRKCREYSWQCNQCKTCGNCGSAATEPGTMLHCDLCDRAFHTPCVPQDTVTTGRWHCVECAVCKSCGARSPTGPAGSVGTPGGSAGTPGGSNSTPGGDGEARWHHQTKRGPGGHKVYSHSLCTPCARAYRIGRYCPLCERSFIGPKGTMQLVICKLCDRQHHQECVRQSSSSKLHVLDYTCGECRRGGITSRAAAVRAAPRTIATLFMAKRRFNKYAHRQYLQARRRKDDESSELEPTEPSITVDEASDSEFGPETDPLDVSEAPDESLPANEESLPPSDETSAAVASLNMDF